MSSETRHGSAQRREEAVRESPDNATDATQGLISIPPVDTHLLRSKHVQQTFRIQVLQPPRMPGQSRRLPVVYATDGNRNFDMLKGLSSVVQTSELDAPPFILVSIGYPSDCPYAGRLLRCREFTFPPYPNLDVKLLRLLFEGELLPEEGAKDFYGAEDFRRFLAEELVPFIDAKYDTLPGDRTYFGHSAGGFFGLFTLFSDPAVFKNYIISSPGLLMHGSAPGGFHYDNYDCGGPMVRDFIASGRSLEGIKLYMSAGAEEEFDAEVGPWKIVTGFYQMARSIRQAAIPGLHMMTELFPGESHYTAYPIAFIHGVQAMLGTRRVTRSVCY
jgi:predicted alpha/beta superfamily hydrolase